MKDVFSDLEMTPPPPPGNVPQPPTPQQDPARELSGYWKPTSAPTPELPTPARSKKWIIFVVIGVIVAGLAGGGYFAYSRGYIAIPGITPKADQLFDKMVDSISEIKNAQYSLRLSIKGEPRESKYTPIFKPGNSNANVSFLNPFKLRGAVAGVTTDDATNVNTNASTKENLNASNTNSYVIEDIGGDVGLGQPTNPLLGLGGSSSDLSDYYSSLFQYIPSDINLTGGITLYIEADKKLSQADGSIRIDGSYTGSDVSAAVDVEARKKGEELYGIINKFPNLFVDTTAIKGKWVKLTSDDSDWYDPKSLDEIDTRKFIDTFKRIFKLALKEKLYTVKQKLPAETIAGVKSEHYLITYDPTKVAAVYDAFITEERANNKNVDAYETLHKSLIDPEYLAMQQRVADNSRVEVWVDKVNGYLRQVKSDLVIVPPENVEKLKDKQFLISMTLTLEKVNQKVSIDAPGNPIDLDEATRLLTGITKEDQQAEKQISRITELRTVLNAYQQKVGSYPDSLDQLTPKMREWNEQCTKDAQARNANANTNGSSYSQMNDPYDYNCYTYKKYEKKSVNITDVYTEKTYAHTKDGDDFKVTYQLTFSDSPRYSYYKETYANGTNTMTSKDYSLEKETSSEKYLREHPVNTNSNVNTNSSRVSPVSVSPVTSAEKALGATTATFTLVEYTDFECPFCLTGHDTLRSVMASYGNSVRWVIRQYPLESIHTKARGAAIGALCARKLGTQQQYWNYVDDLFVDMKANPSTTTDLASLVASDVGINATAFSQCTSSTETATLLATDKASGDTAGVTGVPTTFVLDKNGTIVKTIAGSQSMSQFTAAFGSLITPSTTDTDNDGISDNEESFLYFTDKNKKNTDGDSYDDKTEICGGYNPLGAGKNQYPLDAPLTGCP
ncbi:MAG: thioredoxin domain-containing protein [Candidatus Kerfeldbacteria bacterium]